MLVKLWDKFHGARLVLYYCRFSVLVVVLGGGGLLLVQQGQELALRVGDNSVHALFFYLGVFFWALHSWFSCRRLVEFRFGRPNREKDPVLAWSVDHIPRIIAAGAYLCAITSLLLAWKQKDYSATTLHMTLLILTTATGAVFYFTLVKRRRLMQRFLKNISFGSGADLELIQKILLPVTIVYSTIFTIGGFAAPAYFGFFVGSLGILFFALSSIVPVGSWLVYKTTRLDPGNEARAQDFPVISALFLLAAGFSFINDNHDIRTLGAAPAQQSLEEIYSQWSKSAPLLDGQVKPLIIVATAGGGIRASQWTATVLGGLTDTEPRFQNALFAISSVSGGSVGAAFFDAVLRERDTHCERFEKWPHDWRKTCYQWQTQRALSADFLAPALAGMLYPDLMQRFLPFAIMPDRQRGLELGWERAWRDRFENARTAGLADGFAEFPRRNSGGAWLPVLMLNSTHMETGRRIVTTPIKLEPGRFTDTVDFFQLTGTDLPLSTAAGNSARFPYVSPPGTLPCGPDGGKGSWQRLLCRNGHILDGGYFENFGAITAMQLMQAILAKKPDDKLEPIFVLISSDPGLSRTDAIMDDKPFTRLPTNRGANEALGPVQGLLSTREGRGTLAAKQLRDWVNLCQTQPATCGARVKPQFFYFRMEVTKGEPEPALGWLLSKEAEQEIWRMLTCSKFNRAEFVRLLRTLGTPATHIESASQCNVRRRPESRNTRPLPKPSGESLAAWLYRKSSRCFLFAPARRSRTPNTLFRSGRRDSRTDRLTPGHNPCGFR